MAAHAQDKAQGAAGGQYVPEVGWVAQAEKNEQVALLYKSISLLEENDRLIITMVLDELPYNEIADISGISEGNLRVKIHRIKQKLTEIYNQHARIWSNRGTLG